MSESNVAMLESERTKTELTAGSGEPVAGKDGPEPRIASAPVSKSRQDGAIYWIGGSKGGVGKSMMTMAALDSLVGKERSVVLVECDTSNPDVAQAYAEHDGVRVEPLDLDEADGWIELVNLREAHPGSPIVVNTAARNNVAVAKYARTAPSSRGGAAKCGR